MISNVRASFGNHPGARVLNVVVVSHKPFYDAYLAMSVRCLAGRCRSNPQIDSTDPHRLFAFPAQGGVSWRNDSLALGFAILAFCLHAAFAGRYDVFRDELYFIVC